MKFPILEQFGIRPVEIASHPNTSERVFMVPADQVERALHSKALYIAQLEQSMDQVIECFRYSDYPQMEGVQWVNEMAELIGAKKVKLR